MEQIAAENFTLAAAVEAQEQQDLKLLITLHLEVQAVLALQP
jgi:hypothetical protein